MFSGSNYLIVAGDYLYIKILTSLISDGVIKLEFSLFFIKEISLVPLIREYMS